MRIRLPLTGALLLLGAGLVIILVMQVPEPEDESAPELTSVPSTAGSFTADTSSLLKETDPVAAMLESTGQYTPGRAEVIKSLEINQLVPALNTILREVEGDDQHILLTFLFKRWGQVDPAGALGAAVRLENPHTRGVALEPGFDLLSVSEPESALRWLNHARTHSLDEATAQRLLRRWATSQDVDVQIEQMTKLGTLLSDPALRTSLARELFQASLRKDRNLTAVKATLELLDEPALRQGVVEAIADAYIHDDARKGALWAASLENRSERRTALDVVLPAYLAHSPEEAADWIYTQPLEESDMRFIRDAYAAFTRAYADTHGIADPVLERLETREDSLQLQYAIAGYLHYVGLDSPVLVFENSHLLTNPDLREAVLFEAGGILARNQEHYPDALEVIASSPLTEASKEELRRRLDTTQY